MIFSKKDAAIITLSLLVIFGIFYKSDQQSPQNTDAAALTTIHAYQQMVLDYQTELSKSIYQKIGDENYRCVKVEGEK